jgi:hypothetical protein
MDWCWKNQDEEKSGEEGNNGEFNTHGVAESPKGAAIRRKARNVNIRPFLVQYKI